MRQHQHRSRDRRRDSVEDGEDTRGPQSTSFSGLGPEEAYAAAEDAARAQRRKMRRRAASKRKKERRKVLNRQERIPEGGPDAIGRFDEVVNAAWADYRAATKAQFQSYREQLAVQSTTEEGAREGMKSRLRTPQRNFKNLVKEARREAMETLRGVPRHLTVNVTVFSGARDNVDEQFDNANKILNPHNIFVHQGNREDVGLRETLGVLGLDRNLDFSDEAHVADMEDVMNLLRRNRREGDLTAYWVQKVDDNNIFDDTGGIGTIRGFAAYRDAKQSFNEGVFVTNSADVVSTLAHELGHVLRRAGHANGDAENLMHQGDGRTGTSLRNKQVNNMQDSEYMRFDGE
ncbi:MAG: hypothetical protein H6740_13660 [Alphaproteobacteria bacterium]|nr:hypothetical protein [Alphaproteobacteria bacterium]